MIPELIAYYVFNIYSCIAAVVVGSASTAVVVIKLYYPQYDVFYIASHNRKGKLKRSTTTSVILIHASIELKMDFVCVGFC